MEFIMKYLQFLFKYYLRFLDLNVKFSLKLCILAPSMNSNCL